MQIIIPLSGSGERFARAGYPQIKPLIPVHGKPIIEYVVSLFPGEHDFIFIAREDHLQQTGLKTVLRRIAPYGRIYTVAPHKLGPVHAVLQAADIIPDAERTIVNYCDFYMHWHYPDFKKMVLQPGVHGAIPCYTGFHPHLLHPENVYAGCRVDAHGNITAIQEKHSFEADKMKGHHSVGTYYFQSGASMKHYMKKLVEKQHHLNGEYYVSMVFEQMIEEGKTIKVFDEIPHFCQWGTPKDLEEYLWWEGNLKI
jgi:bifunctional N-acetylglucosamine-1-phosphate-uridyltransferase/glucosamine-1-phosphate-acetyltransferase GlmU-like protein